MSDTLSIKHKRVSLGLTQAELARRVGVSQQTVARWERGRSSPTGSTLEKLSHVLGLEQPAEQAAESQTRYGVPLVTPPVRPLLGRLPLDELTPDDFERFTLSLVSALYGSAANVHRAGGPGHTQGGADVIAEDASAGRVIFQCKRVSRGGRFGPAMVSRAVAEASGTPADRRVLVLSRVASPKARQTARNAGWDVWDHDDIVRLLQVELPLEDARRILRTFFPGFATDFLGLAAAGPWLALEEMYAGFLDQHSLFSHAWELLGRDAELNELVRWMDEPLDGHHPYRLLVGPAGIGKSRLVIELARRVPAGTRVWFVDTNVEVRPEDYHSLGDGPVLLIVDDAHDRQDIEVILRGAHSRRATAQTRVLFTSRPYGEDTLTSMVARYNGGRSPETTPLKALSRADARALAAQIMEASAESALAQRIAAVAGDSTMLTVATAVLVQEKRIDPALLASEAEFRRIVLELWASEYQAALRDLPPTISARDLLQSVAALQPLELGSGEHLEALGSLLGCDRPDDVVQALDRAVAAGVVNRRSGRLRVMPDMLADYLLADACYSTRLARSTGFADRAWHSASPSLRRNLLVNLSRVDWLLTTTDPAVGSLIDTAWSSLENDICNSGIQERSALFSLVAEVAYYQPQRSIELVRWALDNTIDGVEAGFLNRPVTYADVLEALPKVLRSCAYHLDHLDESLELLWTLAKLDRRPTNPHPDHPLRVLSDLAGLSLLKPFEYSKRVIERALRWLATDPHPAVFDVLGEAVKWDAEDHISEGYTLHMRSYSALHVAPEKDVLALRRSVIDACTHAMGSANIGVATGAVRVVLDSLREPGGLFGRSADEHEVGVWESETEATLHVLSTRQVIEGLPAAVKAELAAEAERMAASDSNRVSRAAQGLLDAIGDDLDVEIAEALQHGPWRRERRRRQTESTDDEGRWLQDLARRLLEREGSAEAVLAALETALEATAATDGVRGGNPGPLVAALVELDSRIAESIAMSVTSNPQSALTAVAGVALSVFRKSDPKKVLEIATRMFESGVLELRRQVAYVYGWGLGAAPSVSAEELDLIHRLAADDDLIVARNIVHSLRFLADGDPAAAVDVLLDLRIGRSPDLAEDALMLFTRREPLALEHLDRDQLERVLGQLLECPSIDEYWIEQFLGLVCGRDLGRVVKLLTDRVERAERHEYSYDEYRPLPFGWEDKSPLSTAGHPERGRQLRELLDWASKDVSGWRRHFDGPKLFATVAGAFDEEVLSLLERAMAQESLPEAKRIAHLLSEVPRTIIWERVDWVARLLESAVSRDADLYSAISSALYSAVISGVRSGTPGQPYPQDIEQRDKARAIADALPRGSAAERFYRSLQRSAEADIARKSEDDEELF